MDISKLLNPVSESNTEINKLALRELPACVAAPRDFSKSFLLDSSGYIHLTPPRRTVPYGMEEYWLQPREEYLFGPSMYARRLSKVRRERYRGPYHRDLKTIGQYFDQNDLYYIRNYTQAVQEWRRKVHDDLHSYEHTWTPDCDVYEDMSVDPRAVRTDEEERRVQQYRASMARAVVEQSAATMELSTGAEIAQPRALAPYKASVLDEQVPLLTT